MTLYIIKYEACTVTPQIKTTRGWHSLDPVCISIFLKTRHCHTEGGLLVPKSACGVGSSHVCNKVLRTQQHPLYSQQSSESNVQKCPTSCRTFKGMPSPWSRTTIYPSRPLDESPHHTMGCLAALALLWVGSIGVPSSGSSCHLCEVSKPIHQRRKESQSPNWGADSSTNFCI